LAGYSGGGSVWSAAAKKENASGKTGALVLWMLRKMTYASNRTGA